MEGSFSQPIRHATFLVYYHWRIFIFLFLLLRGSLGDSTSAGAEERQGQTGGLGRRRTKGGGRGGRGRERSHGCPDLAVGSRLATQVLRLRKEEKHYLEKYWNTTTDKKGFTQSWVSVSGSFWGDRIWERGRGGGSEGGKTKRKKKKTADRRKTLLGWIQTLCQDLKAWAAEQSAKIRMCQRTGQNESRADKKPLCVSLQEWTICMSAALSAPMSHAASSTVLSGHIQSRLIEHTRPRMSAKDAVCETSTTKTIIPSRMHCKSRSHGIVPSLHSNRYSWNASNALLFLLSILVTCQVTNWSTLVKTIEADLWNPGMSVCFISISQSKSSSMKQRRVTP